jgi:hypothetical protein
MGAYWSLALVAGYKMLHEIRARLKPVKCVICACLGVLRFPSHLA